MVLVEAEGNAYRVGKRKERTLKKSTDIWHPINGHKQCRGGGDGPCQFRDLAENEEMEGATFLVPLQILFGQPETQKNTEPTLLEAGIMVVQKDDGTLEAIVSAIVFEQYVVEQLDRDLRWDLINSYQAIQALDEKRTKLENLTAKRAEFQKKFGYLPEILQGEIWNIVPSYKGREVVVQQKDDCYSLVVGDLPIHEFKDDITGEALYKRQEEVSKLHEELSTCVNEIAQLQKDLRYDPEGIEAQIKLSMNMFEDHHPELFAKFEKGELRLTLDKTGELVVEIGELTEDRRQIDPDLNTVIGGLLNTVGQETPRKVVVAALEHSVESTTDIVSGNGHEATEEASAQMSTNVKEPVPAK